MQRVESYVLLFMRVYVGAFNLASGINFFGGVWPQPVPADALGAGYMDVTLKLGLFQLAKVMETVAGACLLTDVFVPFALALLLPVTITIFVMNAFFSPMIHVAISGIRNLLFHCTLLAGYFGYYRGLLTATTSPDPLWRRSRRIFPSSARGIETGGRHG